MTEVSSSDTSLGELAVERLRKLALLLSSSRALSTGSSQTNSSSVFPPPSSFMIARQSWGTRLDPGRERLGDLDGFSSPGVDFVGVYSDQEAMRREKEGERERTERWRGKKGRQS